MELSFVRSVTFFFEQILQYKSILHRLARRGIEHLPHYNGGISASVAVYIFNSLIHVDEVFDIETSRRRRSVLRHGTLQSP